MNKQKSRREEAVQMSIEEMDAQQQKIQAELKREELEKRKASARPALLKRIGAGILDFLFMISLAAGLFVFSYFVILDAIGYNQASELLYSTYQTSGLYVINDGQYEQIIEHYNEDLTPEQNYDEPISYFYQNNLRAYENEQYAAYTQRKINSGYYVINDEGVCVPNDDTFASARKTFLENEYTTAINYLFSDPNIINASNLMYNSLFLTILLCVLLSCGVFYFIVPLIDRRGLTLAYKIFALMLVDSKDLNPITSKAKVMFRSFVFVVVAYISFITLYFWGGGINYAYIPFVINTLILAITPSNSGIHDFATRINILNQSQSNAFKALQTITEKEIKK